MTKQPLPVSVVIYGPPGSGKSQHAQALMKFFKLSKIIDPWTGGTAKAFAREHLILCQSSTPPFSFQRILPNRQILHINTALAMAGIQTSEPSAPQGQGRTPLLEFTAPILSLMQEILVERKGSYGDLADNTQRWIDMLRIMGFKFPKEFDDQTCAAIMHITMKLTRMPDSPHHRDNWLDLSNYAVLGLAMLDRKAQEKD